MKLSILNWFMIAGLSSGQLDSMVKQRYQCVPIKSVTKFQKAVSSVRVQREAGIGPSSTESKIVAKPWFDLAQGTKIKITRLACLTDISKEDFDKYQKILIEEINNSKPKKPLVLELNRFSWLIDRYFLDVEVFKREVLKQLYEILADYSSTIEWKESSILFDFESILKREYNKFLAENNFKSISEEVGAKLFSLLLKIKICNRATFNINWLYFTELKNPEFGMKTDIEKTIRHFSRILSPKVSINLFTKAIHNVTIEEVNEISRKIPESVDLYFTATHYQFIKILQAICLRAQAQIESNIDLESFARYVYPEVPFNFNQLLIDHIEDVLNQLHIYHNNNYKRPDIDVFKFSVYKYVMNQKESFKMTNFEIFSDKLVSYTEHLNLQEKIITLDLNEWIKFSGVKHLRDFKYNLQYHFEAILFYLNYRGKIVVLNSVNNLSLVGSSEESTATNLNLNLINSYLDKIDYRSLTEKEKYYFRQEFHELIGTISKSSTKSEFTSEFNNQVQGISSTKAFEFMKFHVENFMTQNYPNRVFKLVAAAQHEDKMVECVPSCD